MNENQPTEGNGPIEDSFQMLSDQIEINDNYPINPNMSNVDNLQNNGTANQDLQDSVLIPPDQIEGYLQSQNLPNAERPKGRRVAMSYFVEDLQYAQATQNEERPTLEMDKFHLKIKNVDDFIDKFNKTKKSNKKGKKIYPEPSQTNIKSKQNKNLNARRQLDAIQIGQENSIFTNNKINALYLNTYLFYFIYELFSQQLQHIYWIMIFALQSIGDIYKTNGTSTLILPVFISVLFIAQINTWVLSRKNREMSIRNDKKVSKRGTTAEWKTVNCSDLKPGDIVDISKEDEVPADLLILHAYSLEKNQNLNDAQTKIPSFIANVDSVYGEASLQQKVIHQDFLEINSARECLTSQRLRSLKLIIGKSPNYFKSYKGVLGYSLSDNNEVERIKNVEDCNFLLRGSKFSWADHVVGCVCYTGKDTRIMKDFPKLSSKPSLLENCIQNTVIIIFIFQLIVSFAQSASYMIWYHERNQYVNVILNLNHGNYANVIFENMLRWLCLLSGSIPFSLYFTLYLARVFQEMLVNMYSNKRNAMLQFEPTMKYYINNLNKLENLGHVEYIACDKTGTLTNGDLTLEKFTIESKDYGGKPDQGLFDQKDGQYKDTELQELIRNQNKRKSSSVWNQNNANQTDSKKINQFNQSQLCMVICHQIQQKSSDKEFIYSGPSQEEVKLQYWAKQNGYEFLKKTLTEIEIQKHREDCKQEGNCNCEKVFYDILYEIPFDSVRKRMTVVVRDKRTKKITAFMKGAIEDIMYRLNEGLNLPGYNHMDENNNYAVEGLRSIAFAERDITGMWRAYEIMLEKPRADKQKSENDIRKETYEKIESFYRLLSVFHFKEQMRDDTKQTIVDLKHSGVKFLILTGDNAAATKNIAFQSGIFHTNFGYQIIELKNKPNIKNLPFARKIKELNEIADEGEELFGQYSSEGNKIGLVVHGEYLANLCDNDGCKSSLQKLIKMVMYAESCAFSRLSPIQKGQIIKLIKENNNCANVMALGNGLNDTHMFNEADVSVGIIDVPKIRLDFNKSVLGVQDKKNIQLFIDNREISPTQEDDNNAYYNIYDDNPKKKLKFELKDTKKSKVIGTRDYSIDEIPIMNSGDSNRSYFDKYRSSITTAISEEIKVPSFYNIDYPDEEDQMNIEQNPAARQNHSFKLEVKNLTHNKKEVNVIGTDVNIVEFKMLEKLQFKLGAEQYRKNSTMALYIFYKGIVLTTPQVLFGFVSGFSATMIYENVHFEAYTYLYTSLAILHFAIFDTTIGSTFITSQESFAIVNYDMKTAYKGNYPNNIKASSEFYLRGMGWAFLGFIDGGLIFALGVLQQELYLSDGTASKFGVWCAGLMIITGCTFITNLRIFEIHRSINFFTIAFVVFGLVMSNFIWYLRDDISGSDTENTYKNLTESNPFMLFVIGCTGIFMFGYSLKKLYHFFEREEETSLKNVQRQINMGKLNSRPMI